MPKFKTGTCFYCKYGFTKPSPNQRGLLQNNATIDHVYPVGVTLPPNLPSRNHPKGRVRACHWCNEKKGYKHPLYWLTIVPSEAGADDLAALLIDLGEPAEAVKVARARWKTRP